MISLFSRLWILHESIEWSNPEMRYIRKAFYYYYYYLLMYIQYYTPLLDPSLIELSNCCSVFVVNIYRIFCI